MREMPVASEKIAVERASRRAGRAATGVAAGSVSPAPVVVASSATPTNVTRGAATSLLWYPSRARRSGHSHEMPNIKQQKKRVRTAAEERLANLRYRSTIKTLAKRLATAAEGGDSAAVESEHRN